jgi:16S rRNA (guanine527-N7)-methyltransferase
MKIFIFTSLCQYDVVSTRYISPLRSQISNLRPPTSGLTNPLQSPMSMDPFRISALLEPFLGPFGDRRLSTDDLDKISTYIDLLLRWNARINLTAIRDPEEIVTRHFGESFFLARHLFPDPRVEHASVPTLLPAPVSGERSSPFASGTSVPTAKDVSRLVARGSQRVIDLGSGAGFPALPIKIWAPNIHLTLIESNHKKATFLREAARALTLTDIYVIPERAETVAARLPNTDLPDSSQSQPNAAAVKQADEVTFRAVEKFAEILPTAIKFLAPNARLAILITTTQQEALKSLPSMIWQTIPIPKSHTGVLAIGYVGTKVDNSGE